MSYEQSPSLSPLSPLEAKPSDRPAKRRRNAKPANSQPDFTSAPGSLPLEGKDAPRPRACAECRRMKLKCDRNFPCQTCVKRGLEGICPEGKLVTGRGTRYILADTEKLHEKILRMADRIRTLEEALDTLHSEHWACSRGNSNTSVSTSAVPKNKGSKGKQRIVPEFEPHPLLSPELLQIKGQLELYGLSQDGTSASSPTLKKGPETSPALASPSSIVGTTGAKSESVSTTHDYCLEETVDNAEGALKLPKGKLYRNDEMYSALDERSRTRTSHSSDAGTVRKGSPNDVDSKPPLLAKSSSLMSGFVAENSSSDFSDEEAEDDTRGTRGRKLTKRKFVGTDASDLEPNEDHDGASTNRKESLADRGRRLLALLPPIGETERLFILACEFSSWIINIALVPSVPRLIADLYETTPEKVNPAAVALALTALSISIRLDGLRNDTDSSSGAFSDASTSDSARYGSQSPRSSRRKHTKSTTYGDTRDVDNSSSDTGRRERKLARDTERELKAGARREASRKSAQWYHTKACQVLGEVPMQSEPEIDVVKTLYLMSWYLCALTDFKDAGRQASMATSLAVKIALEIGLHRDETHQVFPHIEAQERRVLFWSLLHLEERLVFGTAKATTMSSVEITCKRPELSDLVKIQNFPTSAEAIFFNWKLQFLDECILPINRAMKNMQRMRICLDDYYRILSLDSAVRDLAVPELLSPPAVPLKGRPRHIMFGDDAPYTVLMMLRARIEQEKLIAILQVHRYCFHLHVRDQRPAIQRMFLPSAVATFSAACLLVKSVRELYAAEPEMIVRVSYFWYNAFCGATSLFLIASFKPFCPVAILALKELEKARDLFSAASRKCYMAARSYPILRGFTIKALEVYKNWKARTNEDVFNIFGPNGEVTLCKSRLDSIIKSLQENDTSTRDEDLAHRMSVFEVDDTNRSKLRSEPISDDDTFLCMWPHVHKSLSEIVRRLPRVLRDASLDLSNANVTRLLWDFEPLPEDELYCFRDKNSISYKRSRVTADEEMADVDTDVEMAPAFPPDLDWDALSNVLMTHSSPVIAPLAKKAQPHHQPSSTPNISIISNPQPNPVSSRPMSSSSTPSDSAPPLTPKTFNSPFYLLDACSSIGMSRDSQDIEHGDLLGTGGLYDVYSD